MTMKRKASPASLSVANDRTKRRAVSAEEAEHSFRDGLFTHEARQIYRHDYQSSEPYKHGVIHNLLNPTLLRNVRSEIRNNLSFTPKETDIYKIHQSGDLANLDGLDDDALKLLPSLVKLRDALYSSPFRKYLSHVTGAGALSGTKTDMAVNIYTPTCHLLCHDDVIGSRRVSYILYLTDPDRPWKVHWGGALRLYPTEKMQEKDGSEMKVPSADFSKVIPPAFNQLSFFAVQPGESFHDVEEVYAPSGRDESDGDDGRIRMAISGWYHIPQSGEDGFEEGAQEKQAAKSSLAQLQGKADKYDLPQPQWISHDDDIPAGHEDEEAPLTEDDLTLLLKFVNPRYLTPETVEELADAFAEESNLQLGLFLSPKYASPLRIALSVSDSDVSEQTFWKIARPPHKHRFLYSQARGKSSESDKMPDISALVNELFPSKAFHKWLCLATGLELGDCNAVMRRFRRGLDYTLATTYEEEQPQLEVCLGISPHRGWGGEESETQADDNAENPSDLEDGSRVEGGVGGYEVYMAGDEDEDDGAGSDHGVIIPSSHTGAGKRRERADPAVYKSGGDDEDDGILLTVPASWNTLSIALRDKGTLKFVKYVSKSAPGDRWDVVGEYKVENMDEGDS